MPKNSNSSLCRCQGFLTTLLEWIVIVSSVLVGGVLAYLVIARYVFNWPTTGLHTIILISAIWLYMSGALLASRSRQHLVVDYLAVKIGSNDKLKHWHELIVALIQFVIVLFFVYWTWRMFAWGSRFSTTLPDLGIPIWVPQLAIGFNAIGSTCYALRDVRNATIQLISLKS